jgi:predicted transcriptional regulator
MEVEKGKTFRYLKEKREVSQTARDNLKQFIRIKKDILDSLKEKEMTINELTQKLDMPEHEVFYYVMTLMKYGLVQTGSIDDRDEYFSYKLKK